MDNKQGAENNTHVAASVADPRELISLISHELRTPLNSILGFSQLISMDPEVSEKVSRWANSAHDAGLNLTHLIDSLLLFTATDGLGFYVNGEQPAGLVVVPTKVHLSVLLAGVGAEIGSLFATPPSPVTTTASRDLGEVVTSERHLRFAIGQLGRNAAQYAGGAPIRLGAKALEGSDRRVQITIEDDGPGIPAEQFARCATPFYRGDGVAGVGLGLGIPIAERIVTRLGGTMTYENPASGTSMFTLDLPMRLEAGPQREPNI